MAREAAVRWRHTRSGRVVFTNGVFDLLHQGHIDLLVAARRRGDSLIVGMNTDESVRRLKGSDRPVRQESDRAIVLAALEVVDAVVLFGEDTPLDLIRALEPDVLVKGGDYTVDTMVGAREVVSRGGEVAIIPLTPDHSTTATVQSWRGRSEGVHGRQ